MSWSWFIYIRNLIYRLVWSYRLTDLKRLVTPDRGPLKAIHFRSWARRTYAEVILRGRLYYVEVSAYDVNTGGFGVIHGELTIESPEKLNNDVLLELYWAWAVSGDLDLCRYLVTGLHFASLSADGFLRRDLLLRGLGRVGVALEGLIGSSPNYRALHGYTNKIDLCALGNLDDLRTAVNAPLEVGGRK